LFEKLASRSGTPESAAPTRFREVLHVVFVPNYKEDLPILREAIGSIADSNIAKKTDCCDPGHGRKGAAVP